MKKVMCPRCRGKPLRLYSIFAGNEIHYLAECCGSALEELISDYGLKLKGIRIENWEKKGRKK